MQRAQENSTGAMTTVKKNFLLAFNKKVVI